MKELQFHNKKFEEAVRHELLIYDRPITEEDALLVYDLDCSEFRFSIEDCDTLCAFKNIDWLEIVIPFHDCSFLGQLSYLAELTIEFQGFRFDCSYLTPLQELREFTISGGDWSDFKIQNFEELKKLPKLQHLSLHEFGSVDLSALQDMPYLISFYCGYANEVLHTDAISYLTNLEALTLIDITVENLDFLNALNDTIVLDLCGITVSNEIDVNIFNRFDERELDTIIANGIRIV